MATEIATIDFEGPCINPQILQKAVPPVWFFSLGAILNASKKRQKNLVLRFREFPSGSCRAQSPRNTGNTQKIPKNHKIPHRGLGPENTKNYTENGPKMTLFAFLAEFFRTLGAQPTVGDFVFFWYSFHMSGLGGFCALYEPDGIANLVLSILMGV